MSLEDVKILPMKGSCFLSFPEMKELLISELQNRFDADFKGMESFGDLIYLPNFQLNEDFSNAPYWASTSLFNPQKIEFNSIGEAATTLKNIQRSWAPYNYTCFRRATLIQEKLPYVNLKVRKFPFNIPHSEIGLYTLIDEHTMIAASKTSTSVPAGRIVYEENHIDPPSRAYLKIQESLVMAKYFFNVDLPDENSNCFEAGACPGGWTWVLRQLGSSVVAVDRAPLVDSLMNDPKVKFMAHDAFTLTPEEIGPMDWVFSDVICYPERLLEWIHKWLDSGKTKKMICTIKMQGDIDWPLVAKFAEIPNSKIVHLNYNKHELTFIHVGE